MLQTYFANRMHATAVFELFIRKLPPGRGYFVAAGLEQALDYLENLRFTDEDVEALRATDLFGAEFLDWLRGLRFAGDVDALPEGRVFFANEPVLRITAPLPQAQLVESRLVNLVHFETLIASKAARCVTAARGKTLVDFGMRRAHGAEAAVLAARASYAAGFAGTATAIARPLFDIPIFGTMAHSFVQACDSEAQAFERFLDAHRGAVVLLIDTYDTETGAERVVDLARRRPDRRIDAVRLDSGDLDVLARRVRGILDAGGCRDVGIFASGNLDEHRIAALVAAGAPIDGFGVGTSLDVSADAPALDCVYKLQQYAGRARRKRSAGKATWPGAKQIFRCVGSDGVLDHDLITTADDRAAGTPLLTAVMRAGERLAPPPPLAAIRERARAELAALPDAVQALERPAEYRVEIGAALAALARSVDAEFR
jgi:nicotinate phosphoribosyltransferase